MMALRSMRARTSSAVTGCAAAVIVLACAALIWNGRRAEQKIADERLLAAARGVAEELRGPAGLKSPDVAEEERELEGERIAIYVLDSKGRVLQHSRRVAPTTPPATGREWRTAGVPAGKWRVFAAL